MYVQFEGVNSKEAAARFVSRQAWLLENDFRKLAGKSAPIALLGYEVITDEDENLGPIEEVIEQPHQVLLKISLEGNEALIPLHAESLDSIDHDAKKVYVILPDGLLDVYRS
jgi:16S rRNA processing protein RimM